MKAKVYHLQAISALHVGTGQGVGVVDLPIARSRATNLPIVAGSALKGVLRDHLSGEWDKSEITKLFGADNNDEKPSAGQVAFGDAQLLLLPIRSFAGTVAYATCPFILKRYQRDTHVNLSTDFALTDETAWVGKNSQLIIGAQIALEDLDISVQENQEIAEDWADHIAKQIYPSDIEKSEEWQSELKQRFVILPDDIFSFLADTATEIRARIRIDPETRIVKNGALWWEENLPCETVLYGIIGVIHATEQWEKLTNNKERNIQIGGKHSIGRGLCRLVMAKMED